MRRVVIWFGSTVAAVVLLFSYRTSTEGPGAGVRVAGVVAPQAPGVVPGQTSSGAPGAGAGQRATGDEVVNGTVAQTMWGPVQVQVHITGGKIVDVRTLIYPTGSGMDRAINAYALPRLRQQALQAQSANIDGVSGATVTSGGYRESLQSALDAAHFGH